jgi:hypothetical protein
MYTARFPAGAESRNEGAELPPIRTDRLATITEVVWTCMSCILQYRAKKTASSSQFKAHFLVGLLLLQAAGDGISCNSDVKNIFRRFPSSEGIKGWVLWSGSFASIPKSPRKILPAPQSVVLSLSKPPRAVRRLTANLCRYAMQPSQPFQ